MGQRVIALLKKREYLDSDAVSKRYLFWTGTCIKYPLRNYTSKDQEADPEKQDSVNNFWFIFPLAESGVENFALLSENPFSRLARAQKYWFTT